MLGRQPIAGQAFGVHCVLVACFRSPVVFAWEEQNVDAVDADSLMPIKFGVGVWPR